jgi:hypothetical protein
MTTTSKVVDVEFMAGFYPQIASFESRNMANETFHVKQGYGLVPSMTRTRSGALALLGRAGPIATHSVSLGSVEQRYTLHHARDAISVVQRPSASKNGTPKDDTVHGVVSRETDGETYPNCSSLFTDAELPEDHVQNVFHVDSTQKPAQRIGGRPQIFRRQFLALFKHREALAQMINRVLQ